MIAVQGLPHSRPHNPKIVHAAESSSQVKIIRESGVICLIAESCQQRGQSLTKGVRNIQLNRWLSASSQNHNSMPWSRR
jgi:hypothetical protein